MKRIILLISILILIVGCTKQLLIKNYPNGQPAYSMFGQIPERNFYYPFDLPDSLELIWNESVKGSFSNNSVVVEGNYLFTSDLAANIYCFDIETGKTVGADKGKGEIAVSPILNNGLMYYIITKPDETYSVLVKYDIRKGERLKEIEFPGRVGNEMLKVGNSIIFVTDEGNVYNYDVFLQEKWKLELNKKVYSSPAAGKTNLYIVSFEGDIICIDINSGEINYEAKLNGNFESALVIKNSTGLIGSAEGKLIAFNLSDGSEKWKLKTRAKIKSPVVHNGKVGYIGNLAGSLFCFDIESGNEIWRFNSEGMFNAPGALFNNVLLQPDVNRKLLFINPVTGKLIKTIEYEARVKQHPVYFQDRLYVGVDRGELYCYKLVRE